PAPLRLPAPRPPTPALSPYTTLFRSLRDPFHGAQVTDDMWQGIAEVLGRLPGLARPADVLIDIGEVDTDMPFPLVSAADLVLLVDRKSTRLKLQSRENLVCRLLLEKK